MAFRLSIPGSNLETMKRGRSFSNLQEALEAEAKESTNNENQAKKKFKNGALCLLSMKKLEKHLPIQKVRVVVGTWNMNCQIPPSGYFTEYLAMNVKSRPDIFVFGTQESVDDTRALDIKLQEALGPSHVLYHSTSLGALHLSVFLRRSLIWFTSIPETDNYSTRIGKMIKTKGAVAIAFMLFGTSFLFVNSHLTAHDDKIE